MTVLNYLPSFQSPAPESLTGTPKTPVLQTVDLQKVLAKAKIKQNLEEKKEKEIQINKKSVQEKITKPKGD